MLRFETVFLDSHGEFRMMVSGKKNHFYEVK